MSKHYLSIEQMQTLIDKGLDCSNASHIYVDFNDQGDHEYELMVNSKEVTMGAYKSIPCFDLQDIIEILPKKIKPFCGETYYLKIDKCNIYYESFLYGTNICKIGNILIDICYETLIELLDRGYMKTK